MSVDVLAAWALSAMLSKSPPAKMATLPAFPGWSETAEERTERYRGIAHAAAVVGVDRHTTATLLAISFHESGWARDVDLGPSCYRGADGKSVRCDSGRASCMMQVRTDVHTQWTAAELFGDREKCFRAGLEIVRRSQRACSKLGPDFALDAYASGSCLDGKMSIGHQRGLELVNLVRTFEAFR